MAQCNIKSYLRPGGGDSPYLEGPIEGPLSCSFEHRSDRREVVNIIHYQDPIYKNQMTLSVDGVVLDFYEVYDLARAHLKIMLNQLMNHDDVVVVSWTNTTPGTFYEQFSVRLSDGGSFWIGISLNGKTISWDRCRLEFNPNKIGNHPVFSRILGYLHTRTSVSKRRIARFDLAIDIPVDRTYCFLVKDRRLYIERRHGREYTQYLGAKSSSVGRVKLYNKAIESSLDYPLTRLELTLDPLLPYEKLNFPEVYYFDSKTVCSDGTKVTDTERFILNALLQGYGTLNDLGRKSRDKIRRLMTQHVKRVEISETDYEAVLSQLQTYIR